MSAAEVCPKSVWLPVHLCSLCSNVRAMVRMNYTLATFSRWEGKAAVEPPWDTPRATLLLDWVGGTHKLPQVQALKAVWDVPDTLCPGSSLNLQGTPNSTCLCGASEA